MKELTPTDLRNATWHTIKASLNERRLAAYDVWMRFGPGTTREVAAKAQWDICSLRPRTTELFQLGLLELRDSVVAGGNHEGIYHVRSTADWERWREAQLNPQGELALDNAEG